MFRAVTGLKHLVPTGMRIGSNKILSRKTQNKQILYKNSFVSTIIDHLKQRRSYRAEMIIFATMGTPSKIRKNTSI